MISYFFLIDEYDLDEYKNSFFNKLIITVV